MLERTVLSFIQEAVIAYLELLESASHHPWSFFRPLTTLPARLLLCHPLWLDDDRNRLALGLHGFKGHVSGRTCQSSVLWGYECPLTEESIESDHLYPVSLGGPAIGTNQIWLCRVHNMWKGADLLGFPWERGEPLWVDNQLRRMETFVHADTTINR